MKEAWRKFRSTWFWRHGAFFLALFIALCVVAVFALKMHQLPLSETPDAWGQFGDYFGGLLNPIVAGLALFLLAVSVDIQRRELHETKEALKSQAESASRQTFEGTFFQLLARFESVRKEIVVAWNPEPYRGKEALRKMVSLIQREFGGGMHGLLLEGAIGAYRHVYTQHQSELGPYFRTLYHVFKLVYQSDLAKPEQIRYANIARAALTTDDLFLLFYNGLSDEGKKFKPLIEKYGLLKHMDESKLIHSVDNRGDYLEEAFMGAERANA